MIAQDSRPAWQPQPASPAQFQLISDMAKERNIDVTQRFNRPETREQAKVIIEWLKSVKRPVAAPSQTSTPQAKLPVRFDKSGKPMYSYYAVEVGGVVKFFRIKPGRKDGFYFVDVQASDEFYPIRNFGTKKEILEAILAFGPKAAQEAYGQQIGKCGRCGRTLTDSVSRGYGIGPDCRTL